MKQVKSSQISIVIQGQTQSCTQTVVDSARTYFPEAEIILSTWAGSNIEITGYDALVLSKDPGDPTPKNYRPPNLTRQIVSTQAGLLRATRNLAIKTRTDLEFTHGNIFDYFYQYPIREHEYILTNHRVIVSNITTFKPNKFFNIPYAICDFIHAGKTADLMKIFSAPSQSVEDLSWFLEKPKPNALSYFPGWIARFSPETWLTLNLVKQKFDIDLIDSFTKPSSVTQALAEKIMVTNFIVLNIKQLGVKSNKYRLPLPYFCFCYSHRDWLNLYTNQRLKLNFLFDHENFYRYAMLARFYLKSIIKKFLRAKKSGL